MRDSIIQVAFQSFYVLLLLTLCMRHSRGATGGIETIPEIDVSNVVHFYWLEGAFPYNVPSSLQQKFSRNFIQVSPYNAALGVWDTTTDLKFSIQFVCDQYTGSVFPTLLSGNTISWNNTGRIMVTNPLDEDQWIISRHIAQTNGGPYKDLMYYIMNTLAKQLTTYQPITVLYLDLSSFNISTLEGSESSDPGLTKQMLEASSTELVSSTESYNFLEMVTDQLNDIGIVTAVFVNTYITLFTYFSASSTAAPVVSWALGGAANEEVYQWYQRVERCLAQSMARQEDYSVTSTAFILGILQPCYNTSYAYVYKSPSSVYNITLFNASLVPTPSAIRMIYALPDDAPPAKGALSPVDWFIIVLVFLTLPLLGYHAFYRATRFYNDPIHQEGAKLIQSLVHSQLDDDEIFDYFTQQRGSSAKTGGLAMSTLKSVFSRKPSKPSLNDLAVEEMHAGNTALMNQRASEEASMI